MYVMVDELVDFVFGGGDAAVGVFLVERLRDLRIISLTILKMKK